MLAHGGSESALSAGGYLNVATATPVPSRDGNGAVC
jgi:hypothetical protein